MHIDQLFESNLIVEKILLHLDAKSLVKFSSCCRKWRDLANSDVLWYKLCAIERFLDYEYLLNEPSHPLIPAKATTATPFYSKPAFDTDLDDICKWKEIFNRSKHLLRNWQHGIYFIPPLIRGHKGRVSALDCNDSMIASGCSDDHFIKIWSSHELECLNIIKSKSSSINSIKIYNNFIITAGDDGVINVFDQFTGDLKHSLNCSNSGAASNLTIFNEKLICCFSDKSIRVFSVKTFKLLTILRGHQSEIEVTEAFLDFSICLRKTKSLRFFLKCLHCFDEFIVTGSWDKSLILWDLNHGAKLASLDDHQEVVNCVKIRNKNQIVSGSGDSTLKIWNLFVDDEKSQKRTFVKLKDIKTLLGHCSDVYCLDTFGDYIASGGSDSFVIIWNFDGVQLHKLTGHLGNVRFAFIDEHKLITAGDAKKIIIWNYKEGRIFNTLHRNPTKISNMLVNDKMIIISSPEIEPNITVICFW